MRPNTPRNARIAHHWALWPGWSAGVRTGAGRAAPWRIHRISVDQADMPVYPAKQGESALYEALELAFRVEVRGLGGQFGGISGR